LFEPSPEELEARRQELLRIQEREQDNRRFVFVQPRVDIERPQPKPRVDLSDIDRQAQARERAVKPENPLPFSRGNSPERVEATPQEQARGPETPVKPDTQPPEPEPQEQVARTLPPAEFGPWLRRFVAQVRRNWFVPYAAMTFRGRVVLQFNIHKDGHITDIAVVSPSGINAFNLAANNAILGSNPTEPLPPEYPEPKAFFTVTFYYNEQPPN
jgi:TonB family protein